jgi:hypothetical protein
MNHLKLIDIDNLLEFTTNPKLIESQIIDYIMSLRQSGVSYATIKVLIAPIFTFYQLNDVVLNRKKVHRYIGEYKRVVRDKAYSTEQIQQALQNADQRMRCIILLLVSTGCRLGSIPGLVFRNLIKLPLPLSESKSESEPNTRYKITFYEGTSNEYYTFTTRECALTGIDSYLKYRKRCGEKISFDKNLNRWEPEDTPLVREQFDVNDILQARHPRAMTVYSLRVGLALHLVKSGIREVEHPIAAVNAAKRVRKPIALTNGFRKHVISTFIQANLNHEIRELIVDHATHLDQNYFRPTEDQVLQEYLKAEPLLTIDPAARLARENQTLRIERSQLEELRRDMDKFMAFMNKD